jgi:predicted transcriptional regulator
MTITLSDDIHQALKEASIRQHRPIATIIEESLRFRGIKTQAHARDLVQTARARGDLNEENALSLAVEETRNVRRDK